MARISVRLFLGGALLVLVVLALPHGRLETVGMLTVCGGCLLGAALMHVAAGRLPYWAFDAIAAYATVLITGARLFANTAGDNGTGIQALYVWVVLFVFYFLPRSHALLHWAWIGALYGAALDAARPTHSATLTCLGR